MRTRLLMLIGRIWTKLFKSYKKKVDHGQSFLDEVMNEPTSIKELEFFEKLYKQFAGRLYHFALGFLKSKEEAEEAVHDIFIKFWKKKKDIRDREVFKTYLFVLAKNHLLNLIRDKAKMKYETFDNEKYRANGYSAERLFIYNEELQSLEQLIECFPPKRKQVYELKKDQGLTNRQIADKLNISTTMVEKHWKLAVGTLKSHMNKVHN